MPISGPLGERRRVAETTSFPACVAHKRSTFGNCPGRSAPPIKQRTLPPVKTSTPTIETFTESTPSSLDSTPAAHGDPIANGPFTPPRPNFVDPRLDREQTDVLALGFSGLKILIPPTTSLVDAPLGPQGTAADAFLGPARAMATDQGAKLAAATEARQTATIMARRDAMLMYLSRFTLIFGTYPPPNP